MLPSESFDWDALICDDDTIDDNDDIDCIDNCRDGTSIVAVVVVGMMAVVVVVLVAIMVAAGAATGVAYTRGMPSRLSNDDAFILMLPSSSM